MTYRTGIYFSLRSVSDENPTQGYQQRQQQQVLYLFPTCFHPIQMLNYKRFRISANRCVKFLLEKFELTDDFSSLTSVALIIKYLLMDAFIPSTSSGSAIAP